MEKNSNIIIKRIKQYADSLRKYKIYVDGEKIGSISRGKNKEFHLAPGKHMIQLKIDMIRSNKLVFELDENQTINFVCGSNVRGLRLFLTVLYVTIWKSKYLFINVEE